mgnify:CR=1 FL=1|jgi:nucleotide-binding universal stress UspA family protein
MKAIICGTDFSEPAQEAARVAAALASKLRCPLRLVHVVDAFTADAGFLVGQDAMFGARRGTLEDRAQTLRVEFGTAIETSIATGRVFEQLIHEAGIYGAELLVVASLGQGKQHGWLLGSNAERTVQHSPVPVLVVREAQPLLGWIAGGDALSTIVCVDMTHASRAALQWARDLRRLGPCDIEVTYVAWPPAEQSYAGARGTLPLVGLRPEIETGLTDDLKMWAAGAGTDATQESYRVLANWGRADAAIALRAAELSSALVIAGTHRRPLVARLWQGSVTRGLLHYAETNVVCVPPSHVGSEDVAVINRVLAAVDLSDMDREVLRNALGMAPQGGEVHVLHVIDARSDAATEREALRRLGSLLAASRYTRRVTTHIAVRRGDSPHAIIAAYAERMAADAICMGTKKRGRAADLLLGSQSHGVLLSARVPVILVPATAPAS